MKPLRTEGLVQHTPETLVVDVLDCVGLSLTVGSLW